MNARPRQRVRVDHGESLEQVADQTTPRAYAQAGIAAEPRAVDLMVSNQRTGKRIMYGQPDPFWEGETFRWHCVLWLPGSRRFVDATVEQYPEIRRYKLGPIVGRTPRPSPDRLTRRRSPEASCYPARGPRRSALDLSRRAKSRIGPRPA